MSGDSDDFDPRAILGMLRSVARGENPGEGRDVVASPIRIETGGMRGRALACVAKSIDGIYRLTTGAGEITLRMLAGGEFVFPYGEVAVEAPDRARGAVFVDAMASWLGTPMDGQRSIDLDAAIVPIVGDYARLAVRDDADGVRWDVYKLMLAGEEPTELFLRLDSDGKQAAFTEKWSAYREALLVQFDRCLGVGRGIEARTPVDVLGGATLTVPADWIITPKTGSIAITDAADEVTLEVSHQPFPLDPRLPPMLTRLDIALTDADDRVAALARAIVVDRGDLEIVWTEYEYEATDTKSKDKRPARSRILIAANDALQVLVTFAYWPTDAVWAIPAWEATIGTLRLAVRAPDPDAIRKTDVPK